TMPNFTLTTGTDTIVGTDADDLVTGRFATLNPADQLDGGSGHDTLALFGAGTFDLSALAQFTGFEEVDLTNVTWGMSHLTLPYGVDLTVNVDNETYYGGTVQLADGAAIINLGTSRNYHVVGSTGTATITGSNGGSFYLSSGTETIDVSGGYSNSFYLSTGNADITSTGGYQSVIYVSSGKTIVDVGSSQNFVTLNDVGTIDYSDVVTGA